MSRLPINISSNIIAGMRAGLTSQQEEFKTQCNNLRQQMTSSGKTYMNILKDLMGQSPMTGFNEQSAQRRVELVIAIPIFNVKITSKLVRVNFDVGTITGEEYIRADLTNAAINKKEYKNRLEAIAASQSLDKNKNKKRLMKQVSKLTQDEIINKFSEDLHKIQQEEILKAQNEQRELMKVRIEQAKSRGFDLNQLNNIEIGETNNNSTIQLFHKQNDQSIIQDHINQNQQEQKEQKITIKTPECSQETTANQSQDAKTKTNPTDMV